jgi:hypothetical protein
MYCITDRVFHATDGLKEIVSSSKGVSNRQVFYEVFFSNSFWSVGLKPGHCYYENYYEINATNEIGFLAFQLKT